MQVVDMEKQKTKQKKTLGTIQYFCWAAGLVLFCFVFPLLRCSGLWFAHPLAWQVPPVFKGAANDRSIGHTHWQSLHLQTWFLKKNLLSLHICLGLTKNKKQPLTGFIKRHDAKLSYYR